MPPQASGEVGLMLVMARGVPTLQDSCGIAFILLKRKRSEYKLSNFTHHFRHKAVSPH